MSSDRSKAAAVVASEPTILAVATAAAAPRPDSPAYARVVSTPAGKEYFNGMERSLETIEVSGVHLVWSKEAGAGYMRLNGRKDIKSLVIAADRVEIKDCLHFPQTDVSIYADELTLLDGGSISTSPDRHAVPAANGTQPKRGQKGGVIRIYANRIRFAGGAANLDTRGGMGQQAAPMQTKQTGQPRRSQERDIKALPITEEMLVAKAGTSFVDTQSYKDWQNDRAKMWQGQKPADLPEAYLKMSVPAVFLNHAEYLSKYDNRERASWIGHIVMWRISIEEFDKNKKNKKTMRHFTAGTDLQPSDADIETGFTPRACGGDGGDIHLPIAKIEPTVLKLGQREMRTDFNKETLENQLKMAAGVASPVGARGRKPGTPNPAVYLTLKWSLIKDGWTPAFSVEKYTPKDSRSLTDAPPEPKGSAKGGILRDVKSPFCCYTQSSMRAAIDYARDAYFVGAVGDAKEILERLSVGWHGKDDTAIAQLKRDAETLLAQIGLKQDYYNNPRGWVPRLSIETSLQIFHTEIDRGLRSLYAAFLMRKAWSNVADRLDIVTNALQAVQGEIKTSHDAIGEAINKAELLSRDIRNIELSAIEVADELYKLHKKLEADARGKVNEAQTLEKIAGAIKIMSGIAAAFPVGKPYTAIGGGALDVIAKSIETAAAGDPFAVPKHSVDFLKSFKTNYEDKLVKKLSSGVSEEMKKVENALAEQKKYVTHFKAYKDGLMNVHDLSEVMLNEQSIIDLKASQHHFKENIETASGIISGLSTGLASITDGLRPFLIDEAEIDQRVRTELEKLKLDDEKYQATYALLTNLAAAKKSFTEQVLQLNGEIAATVNKAAGLTRASSALGKEELELSGGLDPELQEFSDRLAQSAADRLRKYLYFVARSYSYYFLQPCGIEGLGYSGLIDKVTKLFDAKDALVDSAGAAPAARIDALKGAYDGLISEIGNNFVGYLQKEGSPQENSIDLAFGEDQLLVLNRDGKLRINPRDMGYVLKDKEDIRVRSISIERIRLASLEGAVEPTNLVFTFLHDGQSILTKDGERFFFRAGTAKERRRWGGNYNPRRKEWQPNQASAVDGKLFGILFGSLADSRGIKKTDVQYATTSIAESAPAFYSNFDVSVTAMPNNTTFRIQELVLKFAYCARDAGK